MFMRSLRISVYTHTHIYTRFCYNTCFENTNLLQHSYYIKDQLECNIVSLLMHQCCPEETLGEHRNLYPAERSPVGVHKRTHRHNSDTSQAALSVAMWVRSHTQPYLGTIFCPIPNNVYHLIITYKLQPFPPVA